MLTWGSQEKAQRRLGGWPDPPHPQGESPLVLVWKSLGAAPRDGRVGEVTSGRLCWFGDCPFCFLAVASSAVVDLDSGAGSGWCGRGGRRALLLPWLSPGRHSMDAAGSGQPRQGHETSTNPRREGGCRPPGATPAPTIDVLNPSQGGRAERAQP